MFSTIAIHKWLKCNQLNHTRPHIPSHIYITTRSSFQPQSLIIRTQRPKGFWRQTATIPTEWFTCLHHRVAHHCFNHPQPLGTVKGCPIRRVAARAKFYPPTRYHSTPWTPSQLFCRRLIKLQLYSILANNNIRHHRLLSRRHPRYHLTKHVSWFVIIKIKYNLKTRPKG